MPENPNIIATDEDGNELADNDVEVNGIIPGSGGGSSVFSDDDGDGLFEQGKDGIDVPTVRQQQTRYTPTEVTSSYKTTGESVIYADSSGGAFPITLASADATDGNVVEIYDVGEAAGTNAITIDTEGAESINPGGKSSIDISLNGGFVKLRCRAGNWFTDRNRQSGAAQATSISADTTSITKDVTQVWMSTNQTISTGTVTKIQLDSITVDNLGVFDSSNNQLSIQESGSYIIFGSLRWGSDTGWSTGDRAEPRIHVNGTVVGTDNIRKVGTGQEGVPTPNSIRSLSSGDTVDLRAYQDSGADQTIASSEQSVYLGIGRLG